MLGKFHGTASPDDSFPAYHTVVFSTVEWDVKAIGGCEGLWLSLNEKMNPLQYFPSSPFPDLRNFRVLNPSPERTGALVYQDAW